MIGITAAWGATATVPAISMVEACENSSYDEIVVTDDVSAVATCTLARQVTIYGSTESGQAPLVPPMVFKDGSQGSVVRELEFNDVSGTPALVVIETSITGEDVQIEGQLEVVDSTVALTRATLVNSTSSAAEVVASSDDTTLSLTDSFVRDSLQGAILAFTEGSASITLSFSNTRFTDNGNAGGFGGAITAIGDVHIQDQSSTFEGNVAGFGAGIGMEGGSLDLDETRFYDNHAYAEGSLDGDGSAIGISNGSLECTGCDIEFNVGDGAAVYASASRVELTDVDMVDNQSAEPGPGALEVENGTDTSIGGSYICGNAGAADSTAAMSASAVRIQGGNLVLHTSALSANYAPTPAAALVVSEYGLADLWNLTFVENDGGAAIHPPNGNILSVVNTLFDGNGTAADFHSEPEPSTNTWSWIRWVDDEAGPISTSDSESLSDAEYIGGFERGKCHTEPIPAPGSPLLSTGDPELMISYGIDWIGAYDASSDVEPGDSGVEPGESGVDDSAQPDDTGDPTGDTGSDRPSVEWLSGGCETAGPPAALVLLVVLWGRRRDD